MLEQESRKITNTPERDVSIPDIVISPEMRVDLALAIQVDLGQAKSQRAIKDATLDYFNDMLEMNIAERDEPWPNATNVCAPIVNIMHKGVYSELANAVFVPRLYVINPLDDQATEYSHEVENHYNAEYHRKMDVRHFLTCLNLALRDSISYMELLWEERTSVRRVVFMEPDEKGRKKKTVKLKEVVDFKGVRKTEVEYRDLILSPAVSKNPNKASTVYRRLYLTEGDLRDMVASGTLWAEEVEEILATHSAGMNDMTDDSSTATYEQGGTIQVGDEGQTGTEEQGLGIFEVWRAHTNRYDVEHNQTFPELVLFYYDKYPKLIGGNRYKYWMEGRPFARCVPITRANRNEGFSIPELNRSMQEEANARHNQRGDAMDIQVCPGIWMTANAKLLTPDTPLGPKARYEVMSKDDIGIINMGQLTPDTWEEEALLLSYAMKVSGLEAVGVPLPGGAKVPQRMQQAFKNQSNIILDLMALETRLFVQECLEIEHALNIQYMDDDEQNDLGGTGLETLVESDHGQQKRKLPYEALIQNYQLGVAGTQGSLDQESRSENIKMLYALLMQNPLVQPHLDRVWEVTSLVLMDANLPAYTKYIGTLQDAQKQQEQMAQAAKQQHDEQMQLAMTEHGNNTPALNGKAQQPPPMAPAFQGAAPQ